MRDNVRADTHAVTSPRRAFVAGASGYTGRALTAQLVARGVATHAHVRPGSASLDALQQEFAAAGAVVDTTAWSPDAMTETLRRIRPDCVFALLGTTRRRMRAARPGEPSGYEAVDYALTSLLLSATLAAAPHAHFVYLSAMGVGPRARGDYMRVRWRMEEELRSSGIRHTIIRPAFVTGPDRDESRPLERTAATVIDAGLAVAALFGARRLRQRFRSRTADELAGEILDRVLGGS